MMVLLPRKRRPNRLHLLPDLLAILHERGLLFTADQCAMLLYLDRPHDEQRRRIRRRLADLESEGVLARYADGRGGLRYGVLGTTEKPLRPHDELAHLQRIVAALPLVNLIPRKEAQTLGWRLIESHQPDPRTGVVLTAGADQSLLS